jgi:hypothetical protein
MSSNFPIMNVMPPDFYTAPRGTPQAWDIGTILGGLMTNLSQGIQQRQALAQYNFRNAWDMFTALPDQMKPQVYSKLIPLAKAAGLDIPPDYMGGPQTVGDIWTSRGHEIPEQYRPYADLPIGNLSQVESDIREKDTAARQDATEQERIREWNVTQGQAATDKAHNEAVAVVENLISLAKTNPQLWKYVPAAWKKAFPDAEIPFGDAGTISPYGTLGDYLKDKDPGYFAALGNLPASAGVAAELALPWPTDEKQQKDLLAKIHAMYKNQLMPAGEKLNELSLGSKLLGAAMAANADDPVAKAKAVAVVTQSLKDKGWPQADIDAAMQLAASYDLVHIKVGDIEADVPRKDKDRYLLQFEKIRIQRDRWANAPIMSVFTHDKQALNNASSAMFSATQDWNEANGLYTDWYKAYIQRPNVKNNKNLQDHALLALQTENKALATRLDKAAENLARAKGAVAWWTQAVNNDQAEIAKMQNTGALDKPTTLPGNKPAGVQDAQWTAAWNKANAIKNQMNNDPHLKNNPSPRAAMLGILKQYWTQAASTPGLQDALTQVFQLTPDEVRRIKIPTPITTPPPPTGRGREGAGAVTPPAAQTPEQLIGQIGGTGGPPAFVRDIGRTITGAAGRVAGPILRWNRASMLNARISSQSDMRLWQLVPLWKKWTPAQRETFRKRMELSDEVVKLLNEEAGVR